MKLSLHTLCGLMVAIGAAIMAVFTAWLSWRQADWSYLIFTALMICLCWTTVRILQASSRDRPEHAQTKQPRKEHKL